MKRLRTTDPLTADDIAERFAAAMLRVWKIASDIEQLGIWDEVKHSRYLSPLPSQLVEVLTLLENLDHHPDGLSSEPPPGPII